MTHKCSLRLDREQHFRLWITEKLGEWSITVQRTCDGKTEVSHRLESHAKACIEAKDIMKRMEE